jgi:hypothetical protein
MSQFKGECVRLLMAMVTGVFVVLGTPLLAADSSTERAVHQAMLRNFEACNREDIEATMASCADAMPDREKFRREAVATFEEKDIHYSLVECELLDVRLPWAKARIVQDTHTLDRSSCNACQAGFRNNSALLPKGQRVEYINTFKREKGKWKLYLIISEMREVKSGEAVNWAQP